MESAILRAHDGPEGEAGRAWFAPTDSHAQPENGLGDIDCTVSGRPLCDLFRQNSGAMYLGRMSSGWHHP
jgi:hypothetical protein